MSSPTKTERYQQARAEAESLADPRARAKKIINGTREGAEFLVALAKVLQGRDNRDFGLAHRVLERADPRVFDEAYEATPLHQRAALKILAQQQRAISMYKDEDEPATRRFANALKVLNQIDGFGNTEEERQETLGLYGAVYKRMWEFDAQKENLEQALRYYRHALKAGVAQRQGYAAINAAYVLEILAYQEEAAGLHDQRLASGGGGAAAGGSAAAAALRAEADVLRNGIVREVAVQVSGTGDASEDDWWLLLTVAEAYFGLRDYAAAAAWLTRAADLHDRLKKARGRGIDAWMWESPLRQLSSLARMQAGPDVDEGLLKGASDVLGAFMARRLGDTSLAPEGYTENIVRSALAGKIGLGLSGGGFRASLYHIGVLAKMAELDLLRRVEVLSCVSGGSIIGAHYYLEVRHLLQTKRDEEITREDYIDIVRRIERDFLAGVQRNIRTRVVAEWVTNVKLVFSRAYTRTNRAGQLYERELYARVPDGGAKPERRGRLGWLLGGRERPRWINELRVKPLGETGKFHPRLDNWRRAAKVPILVLNATTLNTGHNWQFTAQWMGEPPARIETDFDSSDWLRRMSYEQAAPAGHGRVRLGDAVAASSCVPGLFEPIVISGLYEGRTVQLVDGGVHDNQGISALLDQDCNVVLISDASGQMGSLKDLKPGLAGAILGETVGGALGVLLRTNDVLMARVRETQHLDLAERHRLGQLRGLMYIHLTKDLRGEKVPWLFCDEPLPGPDTDALTDYDVPKNIQRLLAAVRTDLDSFNDAEAYALMTSGYRMAGSDPELRRLAGARARGGALNWRFLAVEPHMTKVSADRKSPYQRLLKQLEVAASLPFKVWKLRRGLQAFALGLALFAIAAVVFGIWYVLTGDLGKKPVATFGGVIWSALTMVAAMLVGLVVGKTAMKFLQYKKTLRRVLVHLGMSLLGFLVARLHLHVFDPLYLGHGRLRPRPHVFFCYAAADEQYALAVDDALRAADCVTALDGKETLFSEDSAKDIEQRIRDSDVFLFIASPASAGSEVCRRWRDFAKARGKGEVELRATPGPSAFTPVHGRVPADGRRLDVDGLRALLVEAGALQVSPGDDDGDDGGGNGGGRGLDLGVVLDPAQTERAEAGQPKRN